MDTSEESEIQELNLPLEVLFHIALQMDYPEILNFCLTSATHNRLICRNDKFWIQKLQKDFNLIYSPTMGNPRKLYQSYTQPSTFLAEEGSTKRALSAYILYAGLRRPELKSLKPDYSFAQLVAQIRQEWESMSEIEKQPYKNLADLDQARYERAMQRQINQ